MANGGTEPNGKFTTDQRVYLLELEVRRCREEVSKVDSRVGKVLYLSLSALISTLTAIIVVLVQVLAAR